MSNTLKKILGVKLRAARKRVRLKVIEAAARSGVTRNTIMNWERGDYDPSVTQLVGLAALYGCSVTSLLPYDDSEGGVAHPDH